MADKLLPNQGKIKGVHHYQALIIWNVKGTYLRRRRKSKLWTVKWQQTHNCQPLNLKNKLSKQKEKNHRNGDHMEGYPLEEWREVMGGNLQRLRSTNWWVQNRQGVVKNSINGEAKEFKSMTHGHELREVSTGWRDWVCLVEEVKGGKIRTTVTA